MRCSSYSENLITLQSYSEGYVHEQSRINNTELHLQTCIFHFEFRNIAVRLGAVSKVLQTAKGIRFAVVYRGDKLQWEGRGDKLHRRNSH